jgi:hypothetical protein
MPPACDRDYRPFTRNNYFAGKLLVRRDFTDETRFHMEESCAYHEQLLHGRGVVCGLSQAASHEACRDRFVCVEPGSAVDCCGHDIIVARRRCVEHYALSGNQSAAEQRQGPARVADLRALSRMSDRRYSVLTTIVAVTMQMRAQSF